MRSPTPQNSPFRLITCFFEDILNLLYPSKSPNELSLMGLAFVQKAIQKSSVTLYIYGILLDALDGVRARKSPHLTTADGQLVDGYCDRMKEALPLIARLRHRLQKHPHDALETALVALSCILPSIARAAAECMGLIVEEHDPAGGSFFDRTKLLIQSFFWQKVGLKKASFELDQKIYRTNMATFYNRVKSSSGFDWTNNTYDKTAYERLLLYIEVLQEEHAALQKILAVQPLLKKKFVVEAKTIAGEFLRVDIESRRRAYQFRKSPFTFFDNA